jgi:hypothetical protein
MAALARTPVVPETTPVVTLSAHCGPATAQGDWVLTQGRLPGAHASNAKMRFQSFFMLTTIQPSFIASS